VGPAFLILPLRLVVQSVDLAIGATGEHVMQLRKMSELEQRMTDDLNWSESAPEVQQNPEHHGKFVVVYNKRILGVGTDRQALVEEAAKRLGVPWQQLLVVIVPRPGMWEIPH